MQNHENEKMRKINGMNNKIAELIRSLPNPEPTVFSYNPVTVYGKTAYLAGQIPKENGTVAYSGLVGDTISIEDAELAVQICVKQALAWIHLSAGGIENVVKILRLDYFIAHTDGFTDISKIADAGSQYLIDKLGEAGRHSRSVIGVKSLPRNAPILIEMTVALHNEVK
jgi:enamine deaminase RidA (YjgF/YER057c/UK114 family)